MKIKLGHMRRAQWRELQDRFSSTSSTAQDSEFLTLGGWQTLPTGALQRVALCLSRGESERLFQQLKGRFERNDAHTTFYAPKD